MTLMSLPRIHFFSGLMLLLVQLVHGQQAAGKDDIQTSVKQCRTILNARAQIQASPDVPADDPFTVAGQACDQFSKAVASSDPAEIQSAAAALRPILARLGRPPASPQEQLAALEEETSGFTGAKLFCTLPDLAKRALKAGETDKATAYAKQLLQMAPQYQDPNCYGNAIYYGNFVLGRIAVQEGNLAQAGQYLLAAGATPGSATLDTFGPNVTLAKELLEKGQSGVVLQYLALCKNFWKMDRGKLDEWSATIRGGGVPDFTSNLYY